MRMYATVGSIQLAMVSGLPSEKGPLSWSLSLEVEVIKGTNTAKGSWALCSS